MNEVFVLTDTAIVNYGEWEYAGRSIKARIFGEMLRIAHDKIKFYQSDLYHDAVWLDKYVEGPCSIDWVVRESGTFLGESATQCDVDNWPGAVRYRFDLLKRDDEWHLSIYEAHPPLKEEDLNVKVGLGVTVYDYSFPTLGNVETEQIAPIQRKGRSMTILDELLSTLQEKLDELHDVRDEAENAKDDLETFLSDSEDAVDRYSEAVRVVENLDLPDNLDLYVNVNVSFSA